MASGQGRHSASPLGCQKPYSHSTQGDVLLALPRPGMQTAQGATEKAHKKARSSAPCHAHRGATAAGGLLQLKLRPGPSKLSSDLVAHISSCRSIIWPGMTCGVYKGAVFNKSLTGSNAALTIAISQCSAARLLGSRPFRTLRALSPKSLSTTPVACRRLQHIHTQNCHLTQPSQVSSKYVSVFWGAGCNDTMPRLHVAVCDKLLALCIVLRCAALGAALAGPAAALLCIEPKWASAGTCNTTAVTQQHTHTRCNTNWPCCCCAHSAHGTGPARPAYYKPMLHSHCAGQPAHKNTMKNQKITRAPSSLARPTVAPAALGRISHLMVFSHRLLTFTGIAKTPWVDAGVTAAGATDTIRDHVAGA